LQISLSGYQCLRCGHQWRPRSSASGGPPKKCPSCDSRNWQAPPGEKLPPHMEEVFQLYEVPQDQRADIIRYAFHHPGVAQALKEAARELEKVFGKARRRLDLHQDPEEEDWVMLFGEILVKDDQLVRAGALLEEFNRAWFVEKFPGPSDVRINLSFTVKPVDDSPPV